MDKNCVLKKLAEEFTEAVGVGAIFREENGKVLAIFYEEDGDGWTESRGVYDDIDAIREDIKRQRDSYSND